MNEHLDNERISRNLLAPDEADRAHLAVCAACRGEVDRFEHALRAMRGAVRQWSEAEYAPVLAPAPRLLARPIFAAAWSLAIVLCAFLMRPAPPPPPIIGGGEIELLDQVQADIERPVPRGLEPLLP